MIVFRGLVLGVVISLASSEAVFAAQVDFYKPSPALNFTKISVANGVTLYCRKAGGEQEVFMLNGDGKYVPVPPGSYKQKGGNVFVVGKNGLVNPGSFVMLNPQPLPPKNMGGP